MATDGVKSSCDDNSDLIVVGIGASAGGVEALEGLFSTMPEKMGMAFVVIQHLSPDFESLMPQILDRKTAMPVKPIEHNDQIQPNHVYVLPSGKQATISDGRLIIESMSNGAISRPIDRFFESFANEVGENSVGIVLSGTGSDGSRGIRDIHRCEGLVVVQSEQSAKFNGMPRSAIATGIADSVVSVEEIPDALIRFSELNANDSGQSRQRLFSDTMEAEKRIHQLLHRSFGIDFDQYKTGMFGRRLKRRMMLVRDDSFEQYLQRIESNPQELKQLYSDLLIGVTEFFRDPDAFNELQHRILPGIIEAATNTGELRIWIAPCATGEEAYSVAILVDELIRQRQYSLDVKIFATDVNADCIEIASHGVYPRECLLNVSQARQKKYFTPIDGSYAVCRELRKKVVFATHNVLQDAPFTNLNLVCCRNLLIYLKPPAKKKALSLFNFSLKNSGYLFLGPSESVSELAHEFEPVNEKWRIFRKVAPVRFADVNLTVGTSRSARALSDNQASHSGIQHTELTGVYDRLLRDYMPPGILVDSNNQILHIFGSATSFLEFREGRPSNDLLQLLPDTLRVAVANGLKRTSIESKPVVYPRLEYRDAEDDCVACRVTIKPVESSGIAKYLVTFETTKSSSDTEADCNSSGEIPQPVGQIEELQEELQSTRESLHDSILNLKSANEEMQSTNEELIAANEELQSTNEELHSVNEELYTVNSEHQRKITELT